MKCVIPPIYWRAHIRVSKIFDFRHPRLKPPRLRAVNIKTIILKGGEIMATYHCQVKHGGVGKATPHSDYICREGKYASEKLKEQLVYKEHGNMPSFVREGGREYWETADDKTRINGNTYYEFEVALPQELSNEDNIALVKELVGKEIGENKAYTFAIHDKPAANDNEQRQIHAHIMFSTKMQDGIERTKDKFFKQYYAKDPGKNGARGDDRFNGKNQKGRIAISQVRQTWEKMLNESYEKNGLEHRVSCKSLEAQREDAISKGDKEKAFLLDREPQVHLGAKLTYSTKREAAKAPDIEKFYLEKAHPKARHNFIALQQKETAQAINSLRKERILTLQESLENKENVRSIRDGIAKNVLIENSPVDRDKATKEINKNIQQQQTLATQEIAAAQKELKEFRNEKGNYMLSDKKIMQIANDIYTKGDSKKLRIEFENHKKELAKFNELVADYKQQANAKSLPPDKLKSLEQDLQKRKYELDLRGNNLQERIAKMRYSLSSEKAQKAVAEISQSIRNRVGVAKERIDDRRQRIDNLRAQSFVLKEMKENLKGLSAFEKEKGLLEIKLKQNTLDFEQIKTIENPKERIAAINEKVIEMRVQNKGNYSKYRTLSRQRVNVEFARNAAKSVYTHGEYKKLMQAEKQIEKLKKDLAVNPGDIQKQAQLEKMQIENHSRKEKVNTILSTPHAQRTIERMAQSRIEKNYALDSRQTILKAHIAEMHEQKSALFEMKNEAYQDIRNALVQAQEQAQASREMSQGLSAIKSGLAIPEAQAMGGLTANIGKENPYDFKDKNKDRGYER